MFGNPMHRQVLLLGTAQALFQTVSIAVMTIGGLAGAAVAPSPELATAPIAAMFLGTALLTAPASLWMARVGRRPGFLAGAGCGVVSGLLAALGLHIGSLFLLCAGTFLAGAYQAFAQFYRFAAAEVADDAFRPRAVSLVLAAGVFAAFAGPWVARLGGPVLAAPYAGSFLGLALVAALALVASAGLRVPMPPAATASDGARPLAAIMRQPAYAVALFGAATGYGVMILAMTATPIAMQGHAHDLTATALVIQMHVLGMFVPSFFTGSLIARFGAPRIMLLGVALLAGHVLGALTGTGLHSFAASLVLLGIGWNFLFIGGTNLLTTTYSPAERGRAQAANDMSLFVVSLACSLGAGALLAALGWRALNLMLLPWLALAAMALVWFLVRPAGVPAAR